MAKITHPRDPLAGTRRRTTKGRGKYDTMIERNTDARRNSTPSWNRSTKPLTVKKGTKNINKR